MLTRSRSGELADDEMEMEKFWKEVREVLEKESGIGDIEGLIEG